MPRRARGRCENTNIGSETEGRRGVRIAILGTRGIPGNYGGFETFAEELATRLVERGHRITVYCRTGNTAGRPRTYRGVELVHLPAVRHKYAETLTHTFYSAIHALGRRFDIVYVCNSANAPICFIPWARRQRTILNVDGLEWQRAKWGGLAKRYYRWAARLAARMPIEVVTDADVIQRFYREELGRETLCIPYGTELYERGHGADRLAGLGLEPDDYLLYVSRMERENNALLVVQAYRQVDTGVPLVMVGDAPYAQAYVDEVKAAADDRVRFLGYRFGDDYHALQANALAYVQATEVGGTHPALVEALGHRNAVVAHDVPEHREVVGEAGRYFAYRDADDLAAQMRAVIGDPDEVMGLRRLAEERVRAHYTWDAVTEDYEAYFAELVAR
jgi:glycosyltransferase involved in cell wall biosynthesis